MTLQQLRCFITLAKTLHYTDAARQLYLSQPSLSYAISTLENELGVKLFTKSGSTIILTEYAKELLPYATVAVNSADAGYERIKQMKNPTSFRLGYIYSISYDFLPKFLNLIPSVSNSSDVTFSFVQGQYEDIIAQLNNGELELAFTPYADAPGISVIPVFTQEIYLVLSKSHPLSRKKDICLSDLNSQKFALLNEKTNLRQVVDKTFEQYGFKPDIVFEAGDCNSAASFAASDFGITLLPKISPLDVYSLTFTRIRDISITRTIFLAWKTAGTAESLVKKITPYLSSLASAAE